MTSKGLILGCVAFFAFGATAIWLLLGPDGTSPSLNLILGTDSASEVLVLTPDPMASLAPSLPPIINGMEDLGKMTPVDFLNAIKKGPANEECIFRVPIKNWITKQDLPDLLALTNSTEPCPSVALISSSYYDTRNHSTVGQEAVFMLEGYRKGEYPPALNSALFDDSREANEARTKTKDEIVAWCRSQLSASK
jgi:hypothetical protein